MALTVNSNIPSLVTQSNLSASRKDMEQAMERLSSGLRINSAKDDAAGLAITQKMTADIRGMGVAIRNANDGMSMAQTAEGAMGEVTDILQRMRELSGQAANGTMSAQNRTAIQAEMDQLTAEIDNISEKTNFNGIKLLDGTASNIQLQTNVNEGDTVSMKFADVSATELGLRGFRVESTLTTGRVGDASGLAVSDVKINGYDAFATAPAGASAAELAAAINSNIGEHRVSAEAYNTLTSAAPSGTSFAAGDLTINGDDVAAAGSVEELVSNINRDVAGIEAVLNDDGTITLSNNTGNDIVIDAAAASDDLASTGFTDDTYAGFVALTSLDGEAITVEAQSELNGYAGGAGTLADVQAFGLNESLDGAGFGGTAVDNDTITQNDDLRINGVRVGPSSDSSAAAKAAAINAISDETGVIADAKTEALVAVDFIVGAMPGANDFTVNGTVVDISAANDMSDVVTAINDAGVAGIVATADDDGNLILTSEDGLDIRVGEDTTGFVTGLTSLQADASDSGTGTVADPFVLKGRIELSSEINGEIRVESKSANAAALIGFADQGGNDELVSGALTVTTQAAAERALTAIDSALETISLNRADLGAFQNRLEASVNNLTTTSTNMSAARSQMLDADYAAETTALTKAQVVQQAATAMLAQANQSSQAVLSLLQ